MIINVYIVGVTTEITITIIIKIFVIDWLNYFVKIKHLIINYKKIWRDSLIINN